MSSNSGQFYDFGPFRADVSERLLFRGNETVPLTPKAFDLLQVLLESDGRVLTKDELMKLIWPYSFVEEANLSHNIYKLREALGEGSNGEKYIETLPRRGYRFVANVIAAQDHDSHLIVEEHSRTHVVVEDESPAEKAFDTRVEPYNLLTKSSRAGIRNPSLMVAGAIIVVALIGGLIYFWRTTKPHANAAGSAPLHSIAVLPFKPLSANDRDESLEMGMADTLITRLSRISQLTVRPTNAVRRYTKLEDETLKAGRELTVDAVVDGSIQKSGDRVRVSVRLVRVDPGETIWAEQFDEKFTDIFAVQDAISRRVTDMLAFRLSGEEQSLLAKRYTQNADAYQLYLRGRYHQGKRTAEGIRKAVEYFIQAIQADPSYALSYAGLADSYCLLPEFSNAPFQESISNAKVASQKALEIDNTLAEAHTSLGYVNQIQWEWDTAEKEYKRGLELNPGYATGHQWYSEYLVFTGRTDDALKEIKLAQQLDPLSLIVNARIGMTLYYARRYDEAITQLQKTLELDPNFLLTHIFLYASFYEKGMHRETIPHIVKGFLYFYPQNEKPRIEADLTAVYAASGKMGLWKKVLEFMKRGEGRDYNFPYNMAETYMRLGDKDQAFLWLQKAYDIRHPGLAALKVEPAMDGLRDDPRFAEFLHRVNL